MDFEVSDSSGTDDDLPSSHQNKFRSGTLAYENSRTTVVGTTSFQHMHNDMEVQIHDIEQEAYSSVLRAFKAQSDAITWEMEGLITELRKELRVTDDEHRKLLSRVNADDMIGRIREWRKANELQPGMLNYPTASAPYKKPKTSQSGPSLSLGPPHLALHQPMQPSSSALRQASGLRANKLESYTSTGFVGRDQDNSSDPLIGRKVWTRWPDDNNFYEAVISDFNPIEGRHALVYDAATQNEAWEWVNLREISPNDIRWKGEDAGISNGGSQNGFGHGVKKSMAFHGTTAGSGRGKGISKAQSKKDSQHSIGKKTLNDIKIFHTDTLVKEVDKVFSSSNADPIDIEMARKVLKEHEQALVDAIAKLEGITDGESGNISRKDEVGGGSYNEARNGCERTSWGHSIP